MSTLTFTEQTTPTVPAAGKKRIFLKADGHFYSLDSAGLEQVFDFAIATAITISAKNSTGATIPKGAAVYVSGASGQNPLISLAKADAEVTSSRTLGIMQSAVANNALGTVLVAGSIDGMDTSAFADGDTVFLSPTVAGGLTAVKPVAPNHLVSIGTVSYSHVSNGKMVVLVKNGFELEELHNVLIAAVANNDILQYESATGLWKNKVLNKTSVGLSNVDNTTDLGKPISTATQTALNLKVNKLLVPANNTATRALNTTYSAPATGAILVCATVRCAITAAAGTAYVQAVADSGTPPTTIASGIVGIQAGLLSEDNSFSISFIVEAGKNYRINSTTSNGTVTLGNWFETSF